MKESWVAQPALPCILGVWVTPAFCILTVIALLSTLVPFLQELASHGKTRVATTTSAEEKDKSKWWHALLWINKRYFLHFYIIGLLSLGFFVWSQPQQEQHGKDGGVVVVWLLALHLVRRCYECLAVHCYSQNSQMHVAGYICGIFHYTFLPYVLLDIRCDIGSAKNAVSYNPQRSSTGLEIDDKIYMLTQTIFVLLCLWGQYEQYHHHVLLSSLRQSPESTTTTTKTPAAMRIGHHKIPQGRWFVHVSCPHYLAEIIIYVALCAIMMMMQVYHPSGKPTDMSHIRCGEDATTDFCTTHATFPWVDAIPPFGRWLGPPLDNHQNKLVVTFLLAIRRHRHVVLLVWVASNLTVTALRSHRWYHQRFPSYHLLQRKAIVPFIL